MVAAFALIALHVRSIALSSDTARPRLDVPFTVTVTIAVKENVSNLPDVYLPTFYGPEELGDVRSYAHGPAGTLYRETMTLEAHAHGPLHIGAAYMDAIDARDGKPKRFLSNELNLAVQGVGFSPRPSLRALGFVLLWAIAAFAALFAAFALVTRRRTVPSAQPPQRSDTLEVPATSSESVVERLALMRDRVTLLRLRSLLWSKAGANDGATLADLRSAAGHGAAWELLVAVERAAFVEEAQLQAAIDDVLRRCAGSASA